MDAYEGGHDSSLTANATKSFGNPYVAALVKYVEGNGDMKKVFNNHMKEVFPHRVLWTSTFIYV